MMTKRTLQKEVLLSGIGVHSGERVQLRLRPSDSGEVRFRRTDLGNLDIQVDIRNADAEYCTFLETGACRILTVEHLLAALYILGVDSVLVELRGGEIPVMDGSALPFVQAVMEAGIKPLQERKKTIRILKPFVLREGKASVSFIPDSDFRISCSIDYDHPVIRKQELSLSLRLKDFISGIAPARTFGFLKDVPRLREMGLALGGSLENAVVLDEGSVISGPLRFPDEFVRHKVLDFLGDLSLLGHPFRGHFQARRAGHSLHLRAVRQLVSRPDLWTYDEWMPAFLQEPLPCPESE